MSQQESAWRAAPVFGVRNVRQAAEYYRDVLGFALDPVDGVFAPSADEPGGVYAIVERGGQMVHLQIRRGEMPERKRGSFERDAYFYVAGLDAFYAEFQQRGVKILHPPELMPYGLREMAIEDLNGFRLSFGEFV